ncbi:ATP-dependent helicase [Halomonas sp. DP8Y7-1]|uniref:ATP-dependent helicase n=1 Tax=Halomonas sp. DP8Y7-1 TaxID=2859078 RepID=UPI001C96C278|nr:ATP-dependent helicase [Halomonas sp. DP8Y7-1]MBY6030719.1 ATP-dependent helicase [Halomonas sp. DP8Y7-1]
MSAVGDRFPSSSADAQAGTLWSTLTPEQQAVVSHQRGHARVAAVAGAGKTTTLVARVLHLLAGGAQARRMMVLMFNRAAREDFQQRLAAMAPAGIELPEVRTFHSLGHRLTSSLVRWGALPRRELLTADWQQERLLRQATLQALEDVDEDRDAALEPDRIEELAHFCALAKAEVIEPQLLYERLELGDGTRHFVSAFHCLETLMADNGVMTYSDLLFRPLLALEGDEGLRRRVEGFLDHVIIDEYQDINAAQQRLLAVLAGARADVMAVGDANQCIYEWRGAHPDAMLDNFTQVFGAATDYPLSTTFRHGHALALAANHAIAGNGRGADQLCIAGPSTPQTSLSVARGASAFLETLAAWQQQGRCLSDACLLVRSWTLSVPLQLALLREGIPFRLAREDRFVFRLPLVEALAGYLSLALWPEQLRDPAALMPMFAQPTCFVPREVLSSLVQRLAETQAWPGPGDALLERLKPHQKRTLKRRWALLCELPRLSRLSADALLEHVVAEVEAEKVLKRAASRRDKGEEDVRLLDVLIEQAREVKDVATFIELLRRPVENQEQGVLINTVHGAKGLEWPLVIVGSVNEEDFPHYSRDNPLSPQRLEEERRLYYVAITRAIERLVVLHDGGDHRPSRFIQESACQDASAVAEALYAGTSEAPPAPSEPLKVAAPALIQRYLAAIGQSLTLSAAERARTDGEYRVGERVRHGVFGDGEVAVVEGDPANPVIEVRFDHAGKRRLIARRAPIERLGHPV